MKIIFKTLGIIIGLIILLYLVAAVILAFFISPNTYNNLANQYAYQFTGHHISIKGDTHVSIFPSLALKLDDVTVENNPPFSQEQDLAKIGELRVKVALWPILFGKLRPELFVLKNATINLIISSDGQQNWQPHVNASSAKQKPAATTAKTQAASKPSTGIQMANHTIALPTIQIINGNVNIIDRANNKSMHFNKLHFSVDPNNTLDGFKIKFNTVYSSSDQKPLPVEFSTYMITHNNGMSLEDLIVGVNDLDFRGNLNITNQNNQTEGVLKGTIAGGNLTDNFSVSNQSRTPNINMKLNLSRVQLQQITKALLNHDNISGELNFQVNLNTKGSLKQQWLSNMNGHGSMNVNDGKIRGLDFQDTLQNGMQLVSQGKKPQLQQGMTVFNKISASFDIRNGELSSQDLSIDSKNLMVTGNGTIELPTQQLHFSLNLQHPGKQDWQLPLLVKGSLQHAEVELDLKAIAYKLLKSKAKNFISNIFGK